jgi:hypothetical protein
LHGVQGVPSSNLGAPTNSQIAPFPSWTVASKAVARRQR